MTGKTVSTQAPAAAASPVSVKARLRLLKKSNVSLDVALNAMALTNYHGKAE
jgi:hypothetical protein